MSSERAVRVAHVVFDLDRGGMETLLVDLARELQGTPVEISILVLSGRLGRAAQQLAPCVRHLDTHRPMRVVSNFLPLGIARWLRRVDADVVHLHSGAWFKPALAARLAGINAVIFTEHGRQHERNPLKHLIDQQAARLTTEMVAVSPVTVAGFAQDIGVPESRLRVVINGVDVERYRPMHDDGEVRRELGLAADVPIIGSLGRFEHVKGYDILLDAFETILRDWASPVMPALVLAGEGSVEVELRASIAASSLLSRHVHLLPWRADQTTLYRAFTVFVLSSRSEGTSISLLEALACGVCPVVTNVGGNAFVVGDELAHRLVPAESVAALAAGLRAALADDDARRADGRAARERIAQRFSIRTMSETYMNLYRQLAGIVTESAATVV